MCCFILHILGDFCNSRVKEYSVIIGQALDNFSSFSEGRSLDISWVRLPYCFSAAQSVRINNFCVHKEQQYFNALGKKLLQDSGETDTAWSRDGCASKGELLSGALLLLYPRHLLLNWIRLMMLYSDLAQFFTCSFSGKYRTFFRVGNQFNIKPVILIY